MNIKIPTYLGILIIIASAIMSWQAIWTYFTSQSYINYDNLQVLSLSRARLAPDSATPAAGVCAETTNQEIVSVMINDDIPTPRCQKVGERQKLAIRNNLTEPVKLWFGDKKQISFKVEPGQDYIYPRTFGNFFIDGVHILRGEPRSGPELWLISDKFQKGILTGKISIGPLCPVERTPPDPACQPTPEIFAAWPISVFSLDHQTTIAKILTDAAGQYSLELPAGDYVVDLERPPRIGGAGLPSAIQVKAGETTEFNIDIDTGIR